MDPDESTTKTIVVPYFFFRTFSRMSPVEIASEMPSFTRLFWWSAAARSVASKAISVVLGVKGIRDLA